MAAGGARTISYTSPTGIVLIRPLIKGSRQVRHGAERAEDLIEGNPPREVVQAGQMAGRA
jgi:hypothetical protein